MKKIFVFIFSLLFALSYSQYAVVDFIALNESLASACGTYGKPKVVGLALNTSKLSETEALHYISQWERELNLPVTDVIRFGVEKLVKDWM